MKKNIFIWTLVGMISMSVISFTLDKLFCKEPGILNASSALFFFGIFLWFQKKSALVPSKDRIGYNNLKMQYERRGNLQGYKDLVDVVFVITLVAGIVTFIAGIIVMLLKI